MGYQAKSDNAKSEYAYYEEDQKAEQLYEPKAKLDGFSRPSSIEGGNGDKKSCRRKIIGPQLQEATESERLQESRDDRVGDNGRIEDDGCRPSRPSEVKDEEKSIWLLQLGPTNLTRGRFKGQTYG